MSAKTLSIYCYSTIHFEFLLLDSLFGVDKRNTYTNRWNEIEEIICIYSNNIFDFGMTFLVYLGVKYCKGNSNKSEVYCGSILNFGKSFLLILYITSCIFLNSKPQKKWWVGMRQSFIDFLHSAQWAHGKLISSVRNVGTYFDKICSWLRPLVWN